MVRKRGLEPLRPYGHWHLKPARLPFRHLRASNDVRVKAITASAGQPREVQGRNTHRG